MPARKNFRSRTGRQGVGWGSGLRVSTDPDRRQSAGSENSDASDASLPRKSVHWDDDEPLQRTVSSPMSRRKNLGEEFDGEYHRSEDGTWRRLPIRRVPNPFARRSRRLLGQNPGPRAPDPGTIENHQRALEELRKAESEASDGQPPASVTLATTCKADPYVTRLVAAAAAAGAPPSRVPMLHVPLPRPGPILSAVNLLRSSITACAVY